MTKALCRRRRAGGFQRAASTRKDSNEMAIMSKFKNRFLKAENIEAGETVTVKDVRDELVGNPQEAKPVVYLDEYDKGIILNKTNAKALVKVFGDDETTWPGKKIVLTTVPTRNPSTGEEIDAIRMQAVPAKKKAAAEVAAAVDGDNVPF
jgi:hypothetical protein